MFRSYKIFHENRFFYTQRRYNFNTLTTNSIYNNSYDNGSKSNSVINKTRVLFIDTIPYESRKHPQKRAHPESSSRSRAYRHVNNAHMQITHALHCPSSRPLKSGGRAPPPVKRDFPSERPARRRPDRWPSPPSSGPGRGDPRWTCCCCASKGCSPASDIPVWICRFWYRSYGTICRCV